MKIFVVVLILCSFSCRSSDISHENEYSRIILIDNGIDILTLQDVISGLGIKPSDFQTQYKKPLVESYDDLNLPSNPIIVWKNPMVIKNPNPPANRN